MRLEPHEFKQCLVSLGYNLKEGDKVCLLFIRHAPWNVCLFFLSRIMEYFLSFPDDAVERRKLGIKIQHSNSRPQLNLHNYLLMRLTCHAFANLDT